MADKILTEKEWNRQDEELAKKDQAVNMAYNRYLHVKEVRDKYHEAILKQRSHSVMRRMEESRDFNDTVFELMYDSESDTTIQQEETEKIPEYPAENEVTDNET